MQCEVHFASLVNDNVQWKQCAERPPFCISLSRSVLAERFDSDPKFLFVHVTTGRK